MFLASLDAHDCSPGSGVSLLPSGRPPRRLIVLMRSGPGLSAFPSADILSPRRNEAYDDVGTGSDGPEDTS